MPQAQWLLYGVKPVVIAIIIQAIWNLGRKARKNLLLAASGLAILILYFFFHINEIVLLFGGGLAIMLIANFPTVEAAEPEEHSHSAFSCTRGLFKRGTSRAAVQLAGPVPHVLKDRRDPLWQRVCSVCIPAGRLRGAPGLANRPATVGCHRGWTDHARPLFTSATFIGYILGGVPGALLATLGIFLPSFVFVAISNPLIPKMRNPVWVSSFLDGVNIASLSLMAVVTFQLGQASLVDLPTILIALISLGLLLRFKVNSTWLIAGGALAGLIYSSLV